jgi:hypothetical protein
MVNQSRSRMINLFTNNTTAMHLPTLPYSSSPLDLRRPNWRMSLHSFSSLDLRQRDRWPHWRMSGVTSLQKGSDQKDGSQSCGLWTECLINRSDAINGDWNRKQKLWHFQNGYSNRGFIFQSMFEVGSGCNRFNNQVLHWSLSPTQNCVYLITRHFVGFCA